MPAILKNFSLLFLLLVLFFFCKVAILFLAPGILLLFYLENEKTPALILKIIGCSLSFWMAAFWFLRYIPISLTNLFTYCFLVTIVALFYFGIREMKVYCPKIDREGIFFLVLIVYTAILRFLPMHTTLVPPGADMSMHTYMTALISMNNGIPSSYQPIFDIPKFNTFPVGFHAISALISYTANLSIYRSAFVLTCITYLLTTPFLYLVIRQIVSFEIAAVTAFFFTFLASAPQTYVCWGGNPTIFSFIFAVLFLIEILQLKDNQKGMVTAAFFLSAVFLTHTIIFIQTFYILGGSILFYFFLQKNKITLTVRLIGVVSLFAILTSAYLLQIDPDVITPDIIDWIKIWVRSTNRAWHGTVFNCWWSVPNYILEQIVNDYGRSAFIVVIGIAGLYSQIRKKNHELLIWLIPFILMTAILIINTKYWKLPFSYMIYPERTALFAIVPMAILFAAGVEFLILKIKPISRKHKSITITGYGLMVLFLAIVPPIYSAKKFKNGIEASSSVSQDDLNAFAWLRTNTEEGDITRTNYGDAGIWIPAIIQRKVTTAHMNIMHLNSQKPYTRKAKFVFIGSRCVYKGTCPENYAKYVGNPDYNPVYQSEDSYIFELKK